MRRRRVPVLLLALAGACTPKDPGPTKVKYDGPVAEALAALAKDCAPYGAAAGQPAASASDLKCTASDAEVVIHLDKARRVRSLQIKLVAASTDLARSRLDAALALVLDEHHRTHTLSHLDEPVPGGVSPIPQLELEGYLYQVASEPAGGERRYIYRVRID